MKVEVFLHHLQGCCNFRFSFSCISAARHFSACEPVPPHLPVTLLFTVCKLQKQCSYIVVVSRPGQPVLSATFTLPTGENRCEQSTPSSSSTVRLQEQQTGLRSGRHVSAWKDPGLFFLIAMSAYFATLARMLFSNPACHAYVINHIMS